MYYNYVLLTSKNTFYKGLTNDLERRLGEHFLGRSRSTRSCRPLRLIHVEIATSLKDARELELYFKSGFGRENLQEISEERVFAGVAKW